MVNPVQHGREPPELEQGSWYEIDGYETYIVTLETVLRIERQLDSLPEPHWVEFRDVFGSRHRMKSHSISRITESTPSARRMKREFVRSRRVEDDYDSEC